MGSVLPRICNAELPSWCICTGKKMIDDSIPKTKPPKCAQLSMNGRVPTWTTRRRQENVKRSRQHTSTC